MQVQQADLNACMGNHLLFVPTQPQEPPRRELWNRRDMDGVIEICFSIIPEDSQIFWDLVWASLLKQKSIFTELRGVPMKFPMRRFARRFCTKIHILWNFVETHLHWRRKQHQKQIQRNHLVTTVLPGNLKRNIENYLDTQWTTL